MDIPAGELLKEWQSYVTAISRNLMEISEQMDVKIIKLKAKDTVNGFTGLTKIKAAKAVDDLDTLWRYYAILSSVVDKAKDLLSRDTFLKDTEADVVVLLEKTPVILETERIDISTRNLLASENTEKKVSLRQLLKIMEQSFEETRNAFNEISHGAEILEIKLDSIKHEISSLNNIALHLGLKDMSMFDVEKVIKAESDPLQGLVEINALLNNLENYKAQIRWAQEDYKATDDTLQNVREMLIELEDLAQKSQNVYKESQKITGTQKTGRPPVSREVLSSLKDWLNVLQNRLAQGGLKAAKIGAQRLKQECIQKLDAERENYNIISRDYNEWQDMKGELQALLVKFNGLKARGVSFDNSIDVLIENLQKSLQGGSVNLTTCRGLIERLRFSLRS